MYDCLCRYPKYKEFLQLNFLLTVAGKKREERGEKGKKGGKKGEERGEEGRRGEREGNTHIEFHFETKNMPGAYMKIALILIFLDLIRELYMIFTKNLLLT